MSLITSGLQKTIHHFLEEDDFFVNAFYATSLPMDESTCSLKFKDDMVIAGLPFLFEVFKVLGADVGSRATEIIQEFEGKKVKKDDRMEVSFNLPFAIALTGERIALNLLQRASSIATMTNYFVDLVEESGTDVKILDTRKTTPGLRFLEKYAVRIGGGYNHRMGQSDVWMVKDNHKSYFGGLKQAVDFFKNMQSFYNPMVVEVHSLNELKEAIEVGCRHVMLDNFSPEQVIKAGEIKPENMTYEVSGGIRVENIDDYLLSPVDAISIGSLTYAAPSVDVSLKYARK